MEVERVASKEAVEAVIQQVMQKSLCQFARVDTTCSRIETFSKENVSTVYTTLDGEYRLRLIFCAGPDLLQTIANNMLEETVEEYEDVVECAKEFFNVVCGQIVAAVFRETRSSARFHCPHFTEGYFLPENGGTDSMVVSCFQTGMHEPAMFLHDKLVLTKNVENRHMEKCV